MFLSTKIYKCCYKAFFYSRIEQRVGTAFIDYRSEEPGDFTVKELAPSCLKSKQGKNSINDCLTQGQEIKIKVEKEK